MFRRHGVSLRRIGAAALFHLRGESMKLVPKLSLAFIAGTSLVLTVNGYLRVKREVALFESDRVRDDVLIGETLATGMDTVWRSEGREAALAMATAAGAREARVRVRWVWLDEPGLFAPGDLVPSIPVTRVAKTDSGEERRFTFVRVAVPDPRPGALELSESLAPEQAYVRQTIEDTIATGLVLDAVCAVLAVLLGAWLIGRPLGALAAKARRVGAGDFGEPLRMRQNDEIASLAGEMNAMCDRLVEANELAAREMRSRMDMLEQLRHADRLMTVGKLAAGVAHEIGTPLNVVEARAAMIAEGSTSPRESAEFARVIVQATERIAKIIRQLLAFARRGTAQKTWCDLGVLARHTTDLLASIAEKRRVSLQVVDTGGPCIVQADAAQIEQALTNLVMNAIQATDRGVVAISLDRVRALPPADVGGAEGEFARVRVRDEGRGIAPEHLPYVFEPFFTTKDVGEGTGLGLSISYGILREHGGWIIAESRPTKGAEFSVYLPRSTRP
jgi:two-component system NtrC family sensor kinase